MVHTRLSRSSLVTLVALTTVVGLGMVGTVFAGGQHIEVSLSDASAEPAGVFVAVSPLRVLDTRPAPFGPIGVSTPGKLGADSTLDVQLAGDGKAIPSSATSALLNVTLDQDASRQSFLTIWPTGEPRPMTSANNAEPALISANSMIAKLGSNGSISIYNQQGSVNVVIDLVGYMVPLSTADGPGAELFSGSGLPANTVGNDGDFYVDTTNGVLYGPKANGSWPTPGIDLGADGPDGAASAFNTAPSSVLAPTVAGAPIPFDTAGPSGGSVARTNTTTFSVSDDGLYRVDYNLGLTLAVPGTIRVSVNGTPTGPGSVLTALVTGVSNSLLVDGSAGDTIQLMFIPNVAGTSIGVGTDSSVVVEQATAS